MVDKHTIDWQRWLILVMGVIALFGYMLTTLKTTAYETIAITEDNLIQLSYFYKPPDTPDEQAMVIAQFDVIILTRRDEKFRDQILTYTDKEVLQYLRFERIHDPCKLAQNVDQQCGCDEDPFANNVGWEPFDICHLRDDHPDWFLRDENGDLVYIDDTVFMDIGNRDWQEFYLLRVRQSQEKEGWHGVFLDNVRGGIEHFERIDVTIPKYPDDASYIEANMDFLEFLYTSYFAPNDIPVYANLRSMSLDDNETWLQYLQYLDGAMDEFWAMDWGPGYYSVDEWELGLERALLTQAASDHFIAVTHGTADESQRQTFAFASYLLITQGNASFRYADDGYNEVLVYDNYFYELGQPLGNAYEDDGIWKREFDHATVIVNPETHEAEIVVKARSEN